MSDQEMVAMVRPPVEGYFRIPAVWVGSEPSSQVEYAASRTKVACEYTFKCGLVARALQNGTFLFDFLESTIAPVIVIPGWTLGPERKVPRSVNEAEKQAEAAAHLRAQILSAHQACINSSESVVMGRGAHAGFPLAPWATMKAISFNDVRPFHDDPENRHALAQSVLDGRFAEAPQQPRRVIETEVVAHSFRTLDGILCQDAGFLLPIVESTYQASNRAIEMRLGEAISIGWTVCEQLVSRLWSRLLSDASAARPEEDRPSRDRVKKLKGRDYTASIMVEMLELHGRLTPALYSCLEQARRSRNNWAHEMKVPGQEDVEACLKAIRLLLSEHGVHLNLSGEYRSGGPSNPVATVVRIRGEHPSLRATSPRKDAPEGPP